MKESSVRAIVLRKANSPLRSIVSDIPEHRRSGTFILVMSVCRDDLRGTYLSKERDSTVKGKERMALRQFQAN